MVALGFGKSLIMLEKLVVLNNPLSLSLNFFSFIPFLSNFSLPLLASLQLGRWVLNQRHGPPPKMPLPLDYHLNPNLGFQKSNQLQIPKRKGSMTRVQGSSNLLGFTSKLHKETDYRHTQVKELYKKSKSSVITSNFAISYIPQSQTYTIKTNE